MSIPETRGSLVSGDLIQGLMPARSTRMKAYGFLTELALPFSSFGSRIEFVVNVSETGQRPELPPDLFSVYLYDDEGHSFVTPSRADHNAPVMSLTINGQRGGHLEMSSEGSLMGRGRPVPDSASEARRLRSRVTFSVTPASVADDPSLDQKAVVFEGALTEFCNRRCDGSEICTGGAFGIHVSDETFYTFDDVGNLKTQVALVENNRNPLREGPAGQVRVKGVLSGSVLTVLNVDIL